MTAARPPAEVPEPPERDLAECIVAVASARDRDAFGVLFTYFAPRVKTYLRKHGVSTAVADDLAQETLLAVWHKAATFDPAKAGAATWVFTIARNLRIDLLRHERYPVALQDPAAARGQRQPQGEGSDVRADRERLIAQALARLPAEQADVIRLAFFEDRSHAEIERHLGLPLGTVKSRLRLAMRRLRLALGDKA